ncbi:MAG TPA: hypothetical protein DCX52_15175 [Massilia sp.]|nr:hypothetical protein [Massilia sp.]
MNIFQNKYIHVLRRSTAVFAVPLVLAGCMFWSPWTDGGQFTDMPYARGEKAMTVVRSRECIACVNGRQGERAFRIDGRPVYYQEIGKEALALMHARPDPTWRVVGKNYDGTDQWFAPVRIFAPSLRPLILMTIPWSYRGDPRISQVGMEIRAFSERHLSTYAFGMANHVELRSSLPEEARTVRIISKNATATVDMPADRSRDTSIVFDGQKMSFRRTEVGTIQVDFPKK